MAEARIGEGRQAVEQVKKDLQILQVIYRVKRGDKIDAREQRKGHCGRRSRAHIPEA